MGNTKAQRLQREKFITEHFDKIKQFLEDHEANGRELPHKVLNWLNHVARPALGYSDKTDAVQIWFTLRRDWRRVGKQLASGEMPSFLLHVPKIVNPEAKYLHEAYGITEERRVELSAKLDMDMLYPANCISVTPIHTIVDKIARVAANQEEFIFCITCHLMFLAKKGAML